ncbi:hypothetical protein MRX96_030481 [Rhipicephalus microplus]
MRIGCEQFFHQCQFPMSWCPAWFRSAENMLRSSGIPEDVHGAVVVPFLIEKPSDIFSKPSSGANSYEEIRDINRQKLKPTHEECKRHLYTCQKGDETWGALRQ